MEALLKGAIGGCHGNPSSILLCLASRSRLYWTSWLEQAKGRVHWGVVWVFLQWVTWWEIRTCSSHINFSLITTASWESPCWTNEYQTWFKYDSGAFRPRSCLHFGYEFQVDGMLLVIIDIKGSSLHDWLRWTWFILINLRRLAWHLAVVSHTRIMVDRWSSPLAHAFKWIK